MYLWLLGTQQTVRPKCYRMIDFCDLFQTQPETSQCQDQSVFGLRQIFGESINSSLKKPSDAFLVEAFSIQKIQKTQELKSLRVAEVWEPDFPDFCYLPRIWKVPEYWVLCLVWTILLLGSVVRFISPIWQNQLC